VIVFETKRLVFRRFTEANFPDMCQMLGDAEVMRYYPAVLDEAGSRAWLERIYMRYEKYGTAFCAVTLKETDEFVGQIGLLNHDIPEVRNLEIGYMLARNHWGKGYASEGARGCRDHAFGELNQDKVISIIDPRNEPSIRVAQANGMKLEKQIFIQKFNQVENIYSVSRL